MDNVREAITEVPNKHLKKARMGARGKKRAKSGCQTCKIRHKKCDEDKPTCNQCRIAGYRCEFAHIRQLDVVATSRYQQALSKRSDDALYPRSPQLLERPSNLPQHMFILEGYDAMHFDYFRHVCAKDTALVFEDPIWESILVQAAYTESSIFHAALATAVLTRYNYYPTHSSYDPSFARSNIEYAMIQYDQAIKCLNARFRTGVDSTEVAILGCILFISIEGFQGYAMQMHMHLRGGLALVDGLKVDALNTKCLTNAFYQLRDQVQGFEGLYEDKPMNRIAN
ncbi:hypothetical protein BT63DRAFT_425111 [Microthyrium microscopicum]|uniref:Zn(2)-C6 fungal-type domain-containing protein n=1 Tax=Microthyrium microscopicum TaxID=703497 RepID=A0A6A6UDC7_9PEZI|nr:hypothetical protein BT63DRAFT_425111 [Microthyrium microscopicum]